MKSMLIANTGSRFLVSFRLSLSPKQISRKRTDLQCPLMCQSALLLRTESSAQLLHPAKLVTIPLCIDPARPLS